MGEAAADSGAGRRAAAWLVHALTASGALLAWLALAAAIDGRWSAALLWLLAGLAVDGIDGTLARAARVYTRAPRIDGAALDLIVDYLSYVFVPAVILWRAELIPAAHALWLTALILLSSLYCFARTDMKTEDGYFRGFPALWNVVAFYLYAAQPGEAWGAVIVCLLAALTFAPIHVVHPFRVRDYGTALPALALVWVLATAALLWPEWTDSARTGWLAFSGSAAAALIGLGLARTVSGRR